MLAPKEVLQDAIANDEWLWQSISIWISLFCRRRKGGSERKRPDHRLQDRGLATHYGYVMDTQMTARKPMAETAVVVGAGMVGLMTAAVLSEFFARVVIIERDELPRAPALRKGVPQGAHVHTFLGYAVEAMEQLIPGLMDHIYAAGAVKIRRNLDV